MNPKISVIVPVYKVEKFLKRCVDSILAQTFTDFELLLIDDGSPDNSGKICDEYAEKDKRVRVFHKENAGVSSARNLGLDNARGEWIVFADSDDSFHIDTFSVFRLKMDESIDVIEIPYKKEDGEIIYPSLDKSSLYLPQLTTYYANHFFNVVWLKFYKRNLIGKKRFLEKMKIGEDAIFLLLVLPQSKGVYISKYGYYFHDYNSEGAMAGVTSTSIGDFEEQHDIVFHYIVQNKMENNIIVRGFIINEFGYCFSVASKTYLRRMIKTMSKFWFVSTLFSSQLRVRKRLRLVYMFLRCLFL